MSKDCDSEKDRPVRTSPAAPRDAEREPLLECGGPRRVVAAQRPSGQADPVGTDVFAGLQPVHTRRGPHLGIDPRGQALQAQRLTAAGAVDHQHGDAAGSHLPVDTRADHHLLGGVEPVPRDQHRGPAAFECGIVEVGGQRRIPVGDGNFRRCRFDEFTRLQQQVHTALIIRVAAGILRALHAFGIWTADTTDSSGFRDPHRSCSAA